jgi:glycosyltransferase A (GT-A) superfamily protein (DUF2064 family)
MLDDLVERLVARGAFELELVFHPPEAAAWFRERFPEVRLQTPQEGDGLAQRLANHVERAFSTARPRSLVLIGSDQPLLTSARVLDAHRRLARSADVVLGPDLGGGYDLIGLRAPCRELFTRVPMSMGDTCARTAELARSIGLAVEELPCAYDIDVEADLRRLTVDLSARAGSEPDDPEFPRRTQAFLRALR